MAADAKIMEALLRIEHKLDLLLNIDWIRNDSANSVKLAAMSENLFCPVCDKQISYDVDINDSVLVRKCGCSTGKIALDMKAFAPPATPARKKEDGTGTDEEDWRNSDRGGRPK